MATQYEALLPALSGQDLVAALTTFGVPVQVTGFSTAGSTLAGGGVIKWTEPIGTFVTNQATAQARVTALEIAFGISGGSVVFWPNTGDPLAIGGGSAPVDAQYITLATNPTLTVERVLVSGDGVKLTDGGAGNNVTVAERPARERFHYYSDFLGSVDDSAIDFFVSGTGAANNNFASDATNRVGMIRSTSGTTSSGRAGWTTPQLNGIRRGGGQWVFEFGGYGGTLLSGPTQRFVSRIGFMDIQTGDSANGVYFRYTDNVNGGNWQLVARALSVETSVNLGTNIGISSYARLRIEMDFTLGTAQAFINGSPVGLPLNGLPSTTQQFGFGAFIVKTVGTTPRDQVTDYVEVSCLFTTPR